MVKLILHDLTRKAQWFGYPSGWRSLLRVLVSDGTSAQIIYRMMEYCQWHGLAPLAALLYRFNAHLSHVVIGRRARFGPGFVILHSFGIVINSEVRAGSGLVLEHGVTIGADRKQVPLLGDDVFIGAGATVAGLVRVGSRVKIAANSLVIRDLPDGAVAMGVPAQIVRIDKPEATAQGREAHTSLGPAGVP